MSEAETKAESAPETAAKPPAGNVVDELKRMPPAERLLAGAALALVLGFVIDNRWSSLFSVWFDTCALLGALGVLLLAGLALFGVRVLDRNLRDYVLIGFGLLPATGFVIDTLRNFWFAMVLASAITMGVAAIKILLREEA